MAWRAARITSAYIKSDNRVLSDVISEDGNFSPINVLNNTDQLALVDATPLDPHVLALNAQEAAAAFVAAGTAANTVRSYRGALTY